MSECQVRSERDLTHRHISEAGAHLRVLSWIRGNVEQVFSRQVYSKTLHEDLVGNVLWERIANRKVLQFQVISFEEMQRARLSLLVVYFISSQTGVLAGDIGPRVLRIVGIIEVVIFSDA